ncbi:MAG: TolC family protein [Desulfobacteraceae bacterium]|nr:MAG: TolC family protein [Desulfobacteraceae bacterium]
MKMKISLALMMVLLAGCASMRPTDPYKPLDGRGRAVSARPPLTSPATMPQGALTLLQAIEIAMANNPEVAARGWDAAVAQARQEQAFGARLPRLGAVGGYTHYLDDQRLIAASRDAAPGLFSRDIVSGDLVLSMPLFAGGRLVNQVNAAELLQQAAGHRLARSREELVFNVTSFFYNILAQRYVIASLDFSQQTLTEHLKRIDALVEAQKAARVDRMRTDVRLADIQQQLVREKNLMAVQHRALASLLGLGDHAASLTPQGALDQPEKIAVPDLETALAAAWTERGDYLAARAALEAQAFAVDAAKAAHWPTVSLQGAYGGRWAVGPAIGTGDEQGDVGRAGLLLEVPIFEGGQIDARVREQRANLSAAQDRLRALDFQVRLEVETALLNVASSSERAAAIRKSIAQASESLRIEQQKYDLGKGAIVDVLDAQAALLASETTYYRVLADFHTALAQLKLVTGEE